MQVIMRSKIRSTKPISLSHLQRKTVPTLALLFYYYIVNLTIAKNFHRKTLAVLLKAVNTAKIWPSKSFHVYGIL